MNELVPTNEGWYLELVDGVQDIWSTHNDHIAESVIMRNMLIVDAIYQASKLHNIPFTNLVRSVSVDINHSERMIWTWKEVYDHHIVGNSKTPEELVVSHGNFKALLLETPSKNKPAKQKQSVRTWLLNGIKRYGRDKIPQMINILNSEL